MSLSEIDYVRLEEHLNDLLANEDINQLRRGLPDFVLDQLLKQMKKRNANIWWDASAEEAFRAKNESNLLHIVETNAEAMGLSGRALKAFRMNSKVDPDAAMDELYSVLLKREQIRFYNSIHISSKVWGDFFYCRKTTADSTLAKIREGLKLSPEQVKEFDSKIIRRVFPVTDPLRKEVHRLQGLTGMAISDFLVYSFVSKDAWEVFYISRNASEEVLSQKKTSQNTLLKLVVGYGIDEVAAVQFMETAQSAFVDRKDLVVLACISCCYNDPIQVQEILDFFSVDANGDRYYVSQYDE